MTLDIEAIEAILPHRFPFLLIDRVLEVEDGKSATAIKNVTVNEWFFEGHFPGRKVMPGVLIVEALAQTAAVALLRRLDARGKIPMFGGIERMRFRRPVVPGDTLTLEFLLDKMRGPVGRGTVRASVGGELAADGEISFALVDIP